MSNRAAFDVRLQLVERLADGGADVVLQLHVDDNSHLGDLRLHGLSELLDRLREPHLSE